MSTIINASTSSGLVQTADTSGELALQSNGTTQLTVSSTGTYGQLKSGTAQASTSGTSINFTSIPSWVKRITVMLAGVSTSSTAAMRIQIGDAGGIEDTGYVSTADFVEDNAAGTAFTNGFALNNVSVAASTYHGMATLCLLGSNTWVYQSAMSNASTAMLIGAGSKTLSDTLTQLRVYIDGTQTFDAGSINILYEG